MSFSENSHAALDLQVGGSNKKQKTKKMKTRKRKEGNNKSKVAIIKHIKIFNKRIDK